MRLLLVKSIKLRKVTVLRYFQQKKKGKSEEPNELQGFKFLLGICYSREYK